MIFHKLNQFYIRQMQFKNLQERMNISSKDSLEFCELKDINNENVNPFLGFASSEAKECKVNNTEACQMVDQQEEREFQWRSNILITSDEQNERSPFALRHLTSFEEKSMDNHGRRLSKSFRQYIQWVHKQNQLEEPFEMKARLSTLDWETVQDLINKEDGLTQDEKQTLISVAYKSTQAELIISEIIEQIPVNYYAVTLSIAASLVKSFKNSNLAGKEEKQILDYVSSFYILEADKIYQRLCQLEMANKGVRDHECYLNFIKMWMKVFFLSLNGFLEDPSELKRSNGSSIRRKGSASMEI